jgi:TusA-related sulfurtransferase
MVRAPDKTLDVQGVAGLRVKVLALQTLELMERGQVLQVITADRDSTKVMASLCREEGYLLLDEILDGPRHSFLIQR